MKTDDLIRALATDLAPEPPLTDGLWLRLGLALAGCLVMVGAGLGFRHDLAASLINPVSALRIVLALALLAVGLHMARQLARPEAAVQVGFAPLLGVAGAALLAVLWALATTQPADWATALVGSTVGACLISITVLSILPVSVLLVTLRRGATMRPALLGALAGLAGSGGAAAAYALHCTEDSPLFFVTWYGLAMAIVTGASALIGARLLRW